MLSQIHRYLQGRFCHSIKPLSLYFSGIDKEITMSKRGPKPSGRPSKEKYTCPVKDCNARYRGDSIGNHFQKNANLLALEDVLSVEGFSDLKTWMNR